MPLEPGVKIGPHDMMAVAIDTATTFDFEPRIASSRVTFDSLDSLRHTMSRRMAGPVMITSAAGPPISVILNWTELLRPLGAPN